MTEDWRVYCEDCDFEKTFPTQQSASKMVVYHAALREDCFDTKMEEL